MTFSVMVYRRLSSVDIKSHINQNYGMRRFEILTGSEEVMRSTFKIFAASKDVLAVELHNERSEVIDRMDRLVNLSELVEQCRTNPGIANGGSGYWPVVEAVLEHETIFGGLPRTMPARPHQ